MEELKQTLAKTLLPLNNCCETGCKKCPYGRWIKHRDNTWPILLDETLKRIPYWLWISMIVIAYIIG